MSERAPVFTVALAGTGRVARSAHLPVLAKHESFRVTDLAEPDAGSLEAARPLAPLAKGHSSLSDCLRSGPVDIVDVCTPPHLHAQLILEALGGGAHVICEKPLVLDPSQFERIREASRRTGLLVFSVHNWRFAPQFLCVERWLRSGAIGPLRSLELSTFRTQPAFTGSSGGSDWRLSPAQAGGGVLVDHGWHLFSLALGLSGQSPRRVWARLETRRFRESALEDTALCEIEFDDIRARLYMSWAETQRKNTGLFIGDEGTIVLDDDRAWLRTRQGEIQEERFPERLSGGSAHPDWFERMLPAFLHELRHPEARKNLGEAGACLSLLKGAYASHERGGRWVRLAAPEAVANA